MALLIIAVAVIPWTLYQKFYDPPGNRLLKMHLAGVMEPDARGTFEAIKDAYSHVSPRSIAQYKWEHVEVLIGSTPFAWRGNAARRAQREYIWNALGILNLGWIIAAVRWVRRKRTDTLPHCGAMIVAALLNLLLLCMVLFPPAESSTVGSSYADILLLSLGLSGFLLVLPRVVLLVLLALQAINLVFVWVAFRPVSFTLPSRAVVGPSLQWPMIALALCVGGALFWYFATRFFRRDSTAPLADALFQQKPQ
jgi:hypothetical protein